MGRIEPLLTYPSLAIRDTTGMRILRSGHVLHSEA